MIYSPSNWYWIVASSISEVWSSARCGYVPQSDPAYKAWLDMGNFPTNIASAELLFDVLMQQWAPVVQCDGVRVASTRTPELDGIYSIDDRSVSRITSLSTGIAAGKPLPGGGSTFNYPDSANTMHAFNGADFLNFATAIESFIYNFEQNLLTILSGGVASMPEASVTIA